MNNKKSFRMVAVVLCFITVMSVFTACTDRKDNKPVNNNDYIPEWLVEPSIAAQAIQPLVFADFNENTNHYDISYADCFRIMLDGKYGIIDFNGKIVVEPEYDQLFAIRNSDDFLGIINGEETDEQYYIHSDTFEIQRAYKKYNTEKYEYYWNVADSSAVFVLNDNGAVTEQDFSPSLPETVKGVSLASGNYISSGTYGLYANSVNVTDMVYSGAGMFTNGLAAFESNGKWGYLDSKGRTVVPFEYDSVWGYSALGGKDTPYESIEGHITVCKNKKFGILKDDGSVVIEPMFDDATPVIKGKAFAKIEGKWGVILVYGTADEVISDIDSLNNNDITSSTTTTTTTSSTTEADVSSTTTTTTTTTTTSTTTSTTTQTTTENSSYSSGTYIITVDSLNLRSVAGVNGEIVASLNNGTVIYVDKVSNGWGHTVYNGKEGWLSLKYAEKR